MNFTNETIYALIAAKLCGESLPEEEERQLAAWLEVPANREEYARYRSLYEARARLRVWDRVRLPLDFAGRKFRGGFRLPARRWARYAAVMLPLLILAVVAARKWGETPAPVQLAAYDVAPGGSRAVLQKEDGRQFALADSGMLLVNGEPLQGGAAAGTLEYRAAGDDRQIPAETHRLEVGRGGEYKVELPDGSRVWLNSESRLVYPSRFEGDTRRVYLNGEAYFEVRRDEAHPFIVTVDACDVRVLGTAFNVARYTGDRHVVTTVVSGSVEVSAGGASERLLAGQQCLYDPGASTMTLRAVDATRVASWKNGLFIFDDVSIEEIARQIARWYDVDARFADDAARAASFTGAMERYRPASYIVRLLNETNTVECHLENDRALIFRALR
ncbi:MAG: FecR domain-containing protein [Odoribacteraceae bacterium]|jgi:ferric-dicitrate binding protein FerR (iron transport regulator)|nr:FecR domain-containing protein [Odoribacteraceae bacterium]